jgi:hypothetical protein
VGAVDCAGVFMNEALLAVMAGTGWTYQPWIMDADPEQHIEFIVEEQQSVWEFGTQEPWGWLDEHAFAEVGMGLKVSR